MFKYDTRDLAVETERTKVNHERMCIDRGMKVSRREYVRCSNCTTKGSLQVRRCGGRRGDSAEWVRLRGVKRLENA